MSQKDFLASRLEDSALKAGDNGVTVYMDFYEPSVQRMIEREIGRYPQSDCAFFGGSEFSERMMAAIFPKGEAPDSREYPLDCLQATNPSDEITHRDVLGSLIGIGIEREKTGDINITPKLIQVFVASPLGAFAADNLSKISHFPVSFKTVSAEEIISVEPVFVQIDAIVPSLRLDAVVNTVFKMSRSEASAFIKAEKVFINHIAASKPSASVKPGDLISVRSKGRFIIDAETGSTKKGNIKLKIKKFA